MLLDAGTHTYRFWTKSTGTVSGITIANLGNDADGKQLVGWSTIDVSSGQASTNPTMPVIVDSSHVNTMWIDVQLASTAGNTPTASTLGAGDFTLTGAGANGVTLLALAPTQINGNVYRYYLNGHFALGDVTVAFAAGAWTDSGGVRAAPRAARSPSSAPRADVSAPFAGDSIDVTVANSDLVGGALYLDVTFHPTVGANLDYGSIFDAGDEFTVTADTTTIAFGAPVAIAMAPDPDTGALVATVVARNSGESDADYYTRLANAGVTRFRYTATSRDHPVHAEPADDRLPALQRQRPATGWQDSNGNAGSPRQRRREHEVGRRPLDPASKGPTATIVNPSTGGAIDVSALNGRNYIDVTLAPPAGFDLDAASVTDVAPSSRSTAPASAPITIDASQPPVDPRCLARHRPLLAQRLLQRRRRHADAPAGHLVVRPARGAGCNRDLRRRQLRRRHVPDRPVRRRASTRRRSPATRSRSSSNNGAHAGRRHAHGRRCATRSTPASSATSSRAPP